ncbi:MAG: flagellin FliC [Candidatus Hydrogenedentota bacterium]|nr:MAG: flagellin FliC [Candidatus Hydrogenedentota bacterium]
MGGRINTNLSALFSSRQLNLTQATQDKILRRLASGFRINTAADDAAGLAISQRLEALSRGFEQSQANLQDSVSALQVAEGGISQTGETLQRIRELSLQAANDTLTDADRQIIQQEVNQLVQEIDRSTSSVEFNGQKLLSGQFSAANGGFTVQAGTNEGETISVAIDEVSSTTLGVNGLDVSTRSAASNALSTLDTAIERVSTQRARIGADRNRIQQATEFVGVARENTLAAQSRIRDADFANQVTKLAISQIKNQSGVAALAQSNIRSQNLLQLLG